ncbi:Fructose-bisphosphate aldolase 1 [Hypoxylon texense]
MSTSKVALLLLAFTSRLVSNYLVGESEFYIIDFTADRTPPPTVTFTPAQDTKKTGLNSQTTSDGTTFFPFGWFWAPVTPPPGGPPLPPTLPPIPTTATPPKTSQKTTEKTTDKTTKTSDECTQTATPTATIVVSYSDQGNGGWKTITETKDPKDATGSCKGKVVTASTTISPSSISHYDFTGSLESNPHPTDFPDPKQAVLKYLDDTFKSLDFIETSSTTSKPSSTSKASSTSQASPTASGISCDQKTVDDSGSENKPKDYPKSAYQAGAHQFCFGGYGWVAKSGDRFSASNYFWFDTAHIDPDTKLPAYCIGSAKGRQDQWSPASQKLCKGGQGLNHSNSKVWYEVVPSPDQKGCKPVKDYKLPSDQDCVNRWDKVINQCMKDHGTSGIYKEETDNGCWDWRVWGRTLS